MADVTFSGNAVVNNIKYVEVRVAGGTITKHQIVYIDTSDNNEVKPTDADASASAVAYGMALHAAASGEFVLVAKNGATITVGGGLTANTRYVVSTTAGAIAPQADLGSGDYITEVAFANSTTELVLDINATGNTVA